MITTLYLVIDRITYIDDEGCISIKVIGDVCKINSINLNLRKYENGTWNICGRFSNIFEKNQSLETCFNKLKELQKI